MTARLSQAEIARLNTWIGAIAASLKPEDAAEYDGAELRLGSLCLSADGKWYRWSANKGGRGALSLIAHLRGCSELEAVFWARQWLSAHPSDGKALDSISDHDKATRRAANLERILTESAEDTSGTAAEAYLRGRGLEPPYSSSVRFLLDSRIGERGAVFVLTDAADEIVGAQVVNIDPLGRKSTVAPIKQTFTRKPEPQAALRLSCGEPAEGAADLVIVEGLENALACWKAGAGRRVIGVPGVSRLEKVELPKGADVVFFPDGKDAPNSEAAATAKSALACWYLAGVHLRIAKTPMGEDANSMLLACAAEGLRHLGEEAEPYALPSEGAPKAAVDATAQRHATLRKNDPVGYERERKEVAEKLGSRPSTWDAVVARAIAQIGEEAGQGDGDKFTLPDPELYQEPVEGAELLNDIARTVSRFLVLPRGGSSLLALWVVHTHAHDAADHSPILAVTSAEKRCGKTNLLHLLLRLTPRAFESANITAAVLFRVTEACRPTLLIDEADTFLRNDDLRGMLNKGHSKEGAFVPRCVGDEHEPRKFSVWTPKAIACIGSLHPTLTDRAISIRMKRRLKSERVERYRARRHGPELEELCSKAARWAADHRHLLEDADPSLPEALDDRAMDNWRPLVAIADAAGGDWPERARQAALLLSTLAEDESVGVLLLADIRRVFDTKKVARIPSTELSAALGAMEDSPWAEYGKAERPISSKKAARLLREFGIVPQDITLDGKRHTNGYRREQFEDAWKRYLGDTSASKADESPGSVFSILGSSDQPSKSVTYVGSELRSDTRGNEPQNSHNLLKTEANPKIRRLATPAAHESANSGAESPSDIDRASVVNRQGGVRDGELSAGLHTARSGNGITEAGDGADDNGFPDLPPEFDRRPKPTPEPPALNGDDRIVF